MTLWTRLRCRQVLQSIEEFWHARNSDRIHKSDRSSVYNHLGRRLGLVLLGALKEWGPPTVNPIPIWHIARQSVRSQIEPQIASHIWQDVLNCLDHGYLVVQSEWLDEAIYLAIYRTIEGTPLFLP